MTHPTEAAKAAEEIQRFIGFPALSPVRAHSDQHRDHITAIIQASSEAYAAARTRELVEALDELLCAMRRYEMDQECGPPYPHREMMDRITALIATHQPTKEA